MATLGLDASRKTPGVYLAVILGGAGTSGGEAPKRILLMGNPLTAISADAPSGRLAVAGAVQAVATPILLPSADDAGTYFGRGSEIHTMAIRVFGQYPDATLYGCSVAEAGDAATLVCTFATTATAAYTIRVYACGQTIDVAVSSGDTATVIATAVVLAINTQDTLPFYASFSTGTVTLTAKHLGLRGNFLTCAFSFVSSAGIETVITTGSTSSGAATTGILSGGTQTDGEYFFSGGATQDSFANAITAIAATKYDRIVGACVDTANVDRITAHLDSLAGVTSQKRQQGVVGSIASLANAITFATGRNKARLQVAWHYNSRIPIWDVAAEVCAARLAGDSAVGGVLTGEAADPAANLDGMELATTRAQNTVADRPTATEIESALNNGLTPLVPSASRPGYCAIARSVTSRSTSNGVQNYAVLDTSNVTICDYVADDIQSSLATTYAGFKLASNTSDGRPPRAPRVTTPNLIRDEIFRLLKGHEEAAIIRDVDANAALLTCVASATPGRVDSEIPCEPVPGLHVLGGNVRQLS